MISNNPNATVSVIVGAVTTITTWIVGLFGVSIPPEISASVTTLVIGILLFIGKRNTKPSVSSGTVQGSRS